MFKKMISDSFSPFCQHQACQCLEQACAGNENWIGDNYCDDENNNAACQFDGGDCCNNTMLHWDWYCSVSKKGCILCCNNYNAYSIC